MRPDKDDTVKSTDDLRKILDEAGLPNVPIFEVKDIDAPQSEEIKKIVDAIREMEDGTAHGASVP